MSNQMPHPKITTSISAKTKYVSPDGKNYLETNKLDMSFKGVDMSAAELKFALEGILDKLPDHNSGIFYFAIGGKDFQNAEAAERVKQTLLDSFGITRVDHKQLEAEVEKETEEKKPRGRKKLPKLEDLPTKEEKTDAPK